MSIPALGLWLFALVCLLQVVPLPEALHRVLSPTGHAHHQASLALVGGDPTGWRPLSLDPARTADFGLRWLGLGLFALVVANLGFRNRDWRRLLWVVLASGAVVWIIGLVQQASGTTRFLGLYEAQIQVRTLSTFVSLNHASVFYGLVSLAAFALVMQEYRHHVRQTLAAAAVGIVALVLMAFHESDGTVLAYLLGMVVLAAGLSLRMGVAQKALARLGELSGAQKAVIATAFLAAGVIFATLMGGAWFAEVFESSDTGQWIHDKGRARFFLIRAALTGSSDFWLLGSGGGSVEHVLPPYLDWSEIRSATIPTVENEPAEWLLTMGWAPTALACLLFVSGLWWSGRNLAGFERRSRFLAVFALCIYLAFVVQFHFPMFTLGIALPWLVLVEYGMSRRASRRAPGQAAPPSNAAAGGEGDAGAERPARIGRDDSHIFFGVRHGVLVCAASAGAIVLFALAHFGTYALTLDDVFVEVASDDGPDAPGEPRHEVQVDPERLVAYVGALPTDSRLFTRLAVDARARGEQERAVAFARRAFEVRPTSRQLLFYARSTAFAGDVERTVELYRQVFHHGAFADVRRDWIDGFLLRDVREAAARADVLENANPEWWSYAARHILQDEHLRRDGGLQAAVDFSLELIDRHPTHPDAHRTVIHVYETSKQPALAELWARLLVSKNLAEPGSDAPAGYHQLVSLLAAQKRNEEAWQMLWLAAEMGSRDPKLAGWILRLRPPVPATASDDDERLVTHGHTNYCRAPFDRDRRALCWAGEAWLHERHDRLEDARITLRRIADQLHDGRLLADFYARHRMCQQIEGMLRELSGEYTIAHRHKAYIERVSKRCSR